MKAEGKYVGSSKITEDDEKCIKDIINSKDKKINN